MSGKLPRDLDYFALRDQLEEFLYHEAELMDERRWDEWLALLSDDMTYFMPMKRNVKQGDPATSENTREGLDISWFEDDKWTLAKRVAQLKTGVHWAEEPLSRVCHMVSNVQILEARPDARTAEEVVVKSRFLVYQNRAEYEVHVFVGKKQDLLRRQGDSWRLARREVHLDQNVLLAKNLAVIL